MGASIAVHGDPSTVCSPLPCDGSVSVQCPSSGCLENWDVDFGALLFDRAALDKTKIYLSLF